MSEIERDHVLRRAVQTLQQAPAPDAAAIRRVVEAAAAQRVMPPADEPSADSASRLRSSVRRWQLVGLLSVAAAAAVIALVTRKPPVHPTTSESNASHGAPIRAATNAAPDVVPIPEQFVFRSATARRVSVVGDFNDWNVVSSPMTRAANGDLWSVTIPIAPGRHMYGFMVNDSVFTLDPDGRVARARDPDLGVEGSVLIAERP